MRTTNLELFKNWLAINGDLSREDLAHKSRIKLHTLRRIILGEKRPNELEQMSLARALEVDRDELFPLIKQATA